MSPKRPAVSSSEPIKRVRPSHTALWEQGWNLPTMEAQVEGLKRDITANQDECLELEQKKADIQSLADHLLAELREMEEKLVVARKETQELKSRLKVGLTTLADDAKGVRACADEMEAFLWRHMADFGEEKTADKEKDDEDIDVDAIDREWVERFGSTPTQG